MKRLLLALSFSLSIPAGLATAQETPGELQEHFAAAIRAEDPGAVAALYAPGADSYAVGVAHIKGPDGVRADWAAFFATFEVQGVSLEQHGEVEMGDHAAAWGLWKMQVTPTEGGETTELTGRFTDVSMRTPEGWRYIADHASATPPAAE